MYKIIAAQGKRTHLSYESYKGHYNLSKSIIYLAVIKGFSSQMAIFAAIWFWAIKYRLDTKRKTVFDSNHA